MWCRRTASRASSHLSVRTNNSDIALHTPPRVSITIVALSRRRARTMPTRIQTSTTNSNNWIVPKGSAGCVSLWAIVILTIMLRRPGGEYQDLKSEIISSLKVNNLSTSKVSSFKIIDRPLARKQGIQVLAIKDPSWAGPRKTHSNDLISNLRPWFKVLPSNSFTGPGSLIAAILLPLKILISRSPFSLRH